MRDRFKAVGPAFCIVAIAALVIPSAAFAAANHFEVSTPATVTAGDPFTFTVTAKNDNGTTDTAYTGTVSFTSSDPDAVLPSSYAFLPADMGTKTFTDGATLNTPGCRRITASDGALFSSSPPIAVNGCAFFDTETGSLTNTDPTQTGRLDIDPPPSECGVAKANPGLNPATGARAYDSYTYTNLTNGPLCVTVDIDPGIACADGNIFHASYLGSFNPADPSANYLADAGESAESGGQTVSESFTIPAGATFVNVVHAVNSGFFCNNYFYSASSDKPWAHTLPAVVGSATVGSVLGWQTGTWAGGTLPSFTYQWLRCNAAGGGCVEIPGATSGTYEVAAADAGSTLRIRVFATNALGTSSTDSPPTGVIPAVPAAAPTITGRRARAIKRCKKRFPKGISKLVNKKRTRCLKKARRLPV